MQISLNCAAHPTKIDDVYQHKMFWLYRLLALLLLFCYIWNTLLPKKVAIVWAGAYCIYSIFYAKAHDIAYFLPVLICGAYVDCIIFQRVEIFEADVRFAKPCFNKYGRSLFLVMLREGYVLQNQRRNWKSLRAEEKALALTKNQVILLYFIKKKFDQRCMTAILCGWRFCSLQSLHI